MYKIKYEELQKYLDNDEAKEAWVTNEGVFISSEDVDIIIGRVVKNIKHDALLVTEAKRRELLIAFCDWAEQDEQKELNKHGLVIEWFNKGN